MKVCARPPSLRCSLAGVLWALAGAACAEGPLDRYQIILERKPFGATSTSLAQNGVSPAASYAATLRLSAIYELNSESWAGLIDTQSNRSLTLAVGKSDEGIELVSVDLAKEEVVVRKNGETGVLRLESGAPSATPPAGGPGPAMRSLMPGPPPGAVPQAGSPAQAADVEQMQNRRKKLLEELRERIEQQRAARPQANTVPTPGSSRTMVLSSPTTRGQVSISTSGGSGQIMLQINGEAVQLSE
jgi:hypothetical protein